MTFCDFSFIIAFSLGLEVTQHGLNNVWRLIIITEWQFTSYRSGWIEADGGGGGDICGTSTFAALLYVLSSAVCCLVVYLTIMKHNSNCVSFILLSDNGFRRFSLHSSESREILALPWNTFRSLLSEAFVFTKSCRLMMSLRQWFRVASKLFFRFSGNMHRAHEHGTTRHIKSRNLLRQQIWNWSQKLWNSCDLICCLFNFNLCGKVIHKPCQNAIEMRSGFPTSTVIKEHIPSLDLFPDEFKNSAFSVPALLFCAVHPYSSRWSSLCTRILHNYFNAY